MKLYTIGFTGKTAETFFTLLEGSGVKTLWDIRLNNRSQLAGFSKAPDLEFFLQRVCGIKYFHYDEFAPSQELLRGFRNKEFDWQGYLPRFEALMESRKANVLLKKLVNAADQPICLLCSEADASVCHRSLIAARVRKLFPKTIVIHL